MDTPAKRAGIVAIIGRPNAGKSTLLNAILGHKVSITSPKPQTTRFNIHAVYEDDRGQIIFVDTPGVFAKVEDEVARRINPRAHQALGENIDALVYIIDHTRKRDIEENTALGLVRKISVPKVLVVNKIDLKNPTYRIQYKFLEEEFDHILELSALTGKHVPGLVDLLFSLLPVKESLVDTTKLAQPGLNLDSRTFVAEIIREKAFLFLRSELPYTLTTVVDELTERGSGNMYIKARIVTSADRYKAMIVGKAGVMIKEISMAARKELESATGKKVYLALTVETDPHWMNYL